MGGQRGSASLMAFIMMMLLGSMGATLLMLSTTDLQIATNHRDGIAAQYLAEAGIQYAVTKLKTDPEFVSQTETTKFVTTFPSVGTLPAAGNYTVETGPDPQFNHTTARLITAIGVVNQARRQVIAQITLPSQSGEMSQFNIIWKN